MRRRYAPALLLAIALILALPAMASAAIRIKAIYFDPPGSDTQSKLNQEYAIIENTGNHRVNMDGWKLRDKAGHTYRFNDFKLPGGGKVRVHTGHGQDDNNDVYQDSGSYIWNNDGDKATLRKDNGQIADTCSYPDSASSPKLC